MSRGLMPTDAAIWVASLTGLFGALAVTCIGVRFTRNLSVLVYSGVLSGGALGALMYVLWSWFTHGFAWFQVGVPPLAGLTLLLVMTVQNWFVLYEDRRDVLRSSLPALAMLAAVAASALACIAAGRHSFLSLLIWASAGSLAILLCIDPVQQSIERSHSVLLGTLVGIGKVLIPFTGIVVFLRGIEPAQSERERVGDKTDAFDENWFLVNLIGVFWDLGRLLLMIMINGARVPPRPATLDPFEMLGQAKDGPAITGETSRLKRDSVVMIFVLAVHVLCGVVIVKA
jgi:hypothetical protein